MNNMKLSVKLMGGFVIVALITLTIGYVGWSNITKLQSSVKQISENNLVSVKSLLTISEGLTGIKVSERTLIIPNVDQARVDRQMNYFQTKTQAIDTGWKAYEALKRSPEEEAEWKNFVTAYQTFRKDHDEFLRLYGEYAKSKDPAVYANMVEQGLTVTYNSFNAVEAPLLKLVDMAKQNAEKASQAAEATAAQAQRLTLIGMIGGALLAVALGLYLSLSITRPVNRVVTDLTEAAQQVAAASGQLASASQELADGSNEQAASVEETSATLEQASATVQQNAENTRQAASLAAQAKSSADKGNAEMEAMMRSMADLKKSSDQIAKIIKVIDDIAFQTNILALNAAVEAARAGDAGMGFAVVAEEVRNLAQRCAQAAKDTAAIIEGNIELSQQGVDGAQRVRDALGEITLQAKKVNELMDEVAAASQEQSQGIVQINKALDQITTATQQSAAAAEESSSTSEELSSQAANLQVIVGHLVTIVEGRSDRESVARPAAPPMSKAAKRATAAGKGAPGRQAKAGKTVRGVAPEDVIPLEDDTKGF